MNSWSIQGQTFTLTKSHEECTGPLSEISKSIHCYGHDEPLIAFSDDPIKVNCILFILIIYVPEH